MNNLSVFNYGKNQMRTIEKNGETWWALKDICDVLQIKNSRMVAERLDEDEKDDVSLADNIGRNQNTTVINESGLYNVILRSDKPEAKAFKRWVTHEVLPQIHKTGKYSRQNEQSEQIQQLKLPTTSKPENQNILNYGANKWRAIQKLQRLQFEHIELKSYCEEIITSKNANARSLAKVTAEMSDKVYKATQEAIDLLLWKITDIND